MKVSKLIEEILDAVREKVGRDVSLNEIEIRYIDVGCGLNADVEVIVEDGEILVKAVD